MNRAAFFAALRQRASGVWGAFLSRQQVNGVEAILDQAQHRGIGLCHLAAVLAEVHHETGGGMQPVEEKLSYSAKRLMQVWPARFPTLASAESYAGNPRKLANRVYGGRLGNVGADDGWRFRGRGFAQITGRTNYEKFGLAGAPDQACDMAVAVRILFDGMEHGLFTGKRLADFDEPDSRTPAVTGYRYAASRAIINNDVRQNGARIEALGRAFEAALRDAGYGREGGSETGQGKPGVVISFRSDAGQPAPESAGPGGGNRGASGWLARILAAAMAIFARWAK